MSQAGRSNTGTMHMHDDCSLGLADHEFWSDPWRTKKAAVRPLLQQGQEGVLFAAPRIVGLDEHDTFPVLVLEVAKVNGSRLYPRRTAVLTAMNLQTGQLRAALPFPAEAPSRAPASQSQDSFANDDKAMSSQGHIVELARCLSLPAERGEYLLTLLMMDQPSKRCRMKVVESAAFLDPEIDRFLEHYLARSQASAQVQPSSRSAPISYGPLKGSPPIPEETGIRFHLRRVQAIEDRTRCPLLASYRLPLRRMHRVSPETDGPSGTKTVIPITLLLTGSVEPAPRLLELQVEASLTKMDQGPMATGHFALDLCQMADLLRQPQTYAVYAFSGEVLAGPVLTAFVRIPAALGKGFGA